MNKVEKSMTSFKEKWILRKEQSRDECNIPTIKKQQQNVILVPHFHRRKESFSPLIFEMKELSSIH